MKKISDEVFAQASTISKGGRSLFEASHITTKNVNEFHSDQKVVKAAIRKLKQCGFTVHPTGVTTLGISGPPKLFNESFGIKLKQIPPKGDSTVVKYKPQIQWINTSSERDGFIATQKSKFSDVIEGIALARLYDYFEHPLPPPIDYWHLNMPGDVSLLMNADKAHRNGFTGKNVRVTLIDSGFYEHVYYKQRGYRYTGVWIPPFTRYPTDDFKGHGTGIAANLFAVAPDCILTMVKRYADSVLEFNTAAEYIQPTPDIISCSWGKSVNRELDFSDYDRAMEAAIANAIRKNIIVVFSAGNGQYGFPGQHPDVISAGGAYFDENFRLLASSYASSFESQIYPGRMVPDVCGLVGPAPKGIYIMLPVPPNSLFDQELAGVFTPGFEQSPPFDDTTSRDGWLVASGTSSAAPQIAGICALMRQKLPTLSPEAAKSILKKTATDVIQGVGSLDTYSHIATQGEDLATGSGLGNAWEAVLRQGEFDIDPSVRFPDI